MPYFLCRSKPYLLATNLKAMFSTLTTQPKLERLSRPHQLWHTCLRRGRVRDVGPQYLIVRDPYQRLISFFRDKFRQHPLSVDAATPYDAWQTCQRLFFPQLGITRSTPPEAIRRALIEISFEQFINYLPLVIHYDAHLRPQNRIRLITVKGVPFGSFPIDRVLKMEDAADMRFLSDELCVDTKTRHNASDATTRDDPYTPQLLSTVNRLYADDFQVFGYGLRS